MQIFESQVKFKSTISVQWCSRHGYLIFILVVKVIENYAAD